MLGGSFPASLARHPRSPRHPYERAKLNNVLDLRDRPEKKEGIHVLGRRNGGCSVTRLTAGSGGPSIQWLIGVAIERDEACAIANHSLEPALANSAPAHLLQSFWLLSEHWACAAELSKPVFFNTTFCE